VSRLIWLSHPEVAVDPAKAVPDWALSNPGRARRSRVWRGCGQTGNCAS